MFTDAIHGSLSLKNLSTSMSGVYICKAHNKVGTAQCNVTLEVSTGQLGVSVVKEKAGQGWGCKREEETSHCNRARNLSGSNVCTNVCSVTVFCVPTTSSQQGKRENVCGGSGVQWGSQRGGEQLGALL